MLVEVRYLVVVVVMVLCGGVWCAGGGGGEVVLTRAVWRCNKVAMAVMMRWCCGGVW